MSNLTVITPPAEPPVSLADAKKYLRVGHAGEDQLIADLVEAASVRLEQLAGLALVKQTRQLTWLRWPATIAGRGIRLPISPIIELKSVLITAEDLTATDIVDRFRIDCGRIALRPWSRLPGLSLNDRVDVLIEAGFGAASDVPDDLQEAVLRLVAANYAARQPDRGSLGIPNGIPAEVQSILAARKEVRL